MRFSSFITVFLIILFITTTGVEARLGDTRRKGGEESPVESMTLRITVIHDFVRQDDGTLSKDEETIAIPIVDGIESSNMYSIELPDNVVTNNFDTLSTGTLMLSVTCVHLTDDKIMFTKDSAVSVMGKIPNMERKLKKHGTHKFAVLRVSMAWGDYRMRQVSYSSKELSNHLFDNQQVSLVKQVQRCSGGQLKIEPAGVYDITVPGKASDYKSASRLRNTALDILCKRKGVKSANELADHVMVVIPPNNFPGFVGNAVVNHWLSTINDRWSLDVTVYMHELGHNLGLGHAILTDHTWDYSSYMSATGTAPNLTGPLKCFNAASNRQLGWFEDRRQDVDFKNSAHVVTVAAFSEIDKDQSQDPVLVTLGPYSLQYNYASAFNRDNTKILRDVVTIAHSVPGKTMVEKDGLTPGGPVFSIDDFGGSGEMLQIEACKVIPGNRSMPNAMVLGISMGQSTRSPCEVLQETTAPTDAPTPALVDTECDIRTCPDTSKLTVQFMYKKKVVTVSCEWLAHRSWHLKNCFRQTVDSSKMRKCGDRIERVLDVCQQECASLTDLCVPAV